MRHHRLAHPSDEALPWADPVRSFLAFKAAQGRSERTVTDCHKHLGRLAPALPSERDELRGAVLAYFKDVAAMSPTYYNLGLEYASAFFKWCVSDGHLADNPCAGLTKRRNEGQPRAVDDDTVRELQSLPDLSTWAGLRDKAFMLLALDTGIRTGEALALSVADLDVDHALLIVRRAVAKTRTPRTLPLSPATVHILRRLLRARHPTWTPDVPLLCSENGRHLAVYDLGDRFQAYSKRLGVKVTAYSLRHSFALRYLRRGGDAFSLRLMLGHTGLQTTQRYVRLAGEDIRSTHDRVGPLEGLAPNGALIEGRRTSAERWANTPRTNH